MIRAEETPRALGALAIDVAGLCKSWPERGAWYRKKMPRCDFLHDVSFAVATGEIVVVLGENGAGKTTLLKIVAGLALADAGTVSVGARLAYAAGERGFYYRLTARENLRFFGALDGLSVRTCAERIVEVARIVDLEAALDRRFADLSSGMRQRLAFARALLSDAEILLLDEPTRALDPIHADDLRRFIRETLAASGKTIVVATNSIDEALELGDRIAVVRERKLVFLDRSPRELDRAAMRDLFGMTRRA